MFVIQFHSNPPSYYDGSQGDPGRTTEITRAKRYGSGNSAVRAAGQLWRHYHRGWTLVQLSDKAKNDN